MLNYNEYEKAIFDWLMEKHNIDNSFTFSVRQKAMKGSETDYFIGTKTSMYFGTTFWTIPVYYPGSSTDLIDLFFKYTDDNYYTYYFEFTQAKNRPENQNKLAILFLNLIKPKIKEEFQLLSETNEEHKMETFRIRSKKEKYESIEELIHDVNQDVEKVFPIVQFGIDSVKRTDTNFEAHRITPDEFDKLLDKLNKRLGKHGEDKQIVNSSIEENKIMETNYPLNQILYGPPGTGKTYNSIKLALQIINDEEEKNLDWNNWSECKALYDKRVNEGRIGFVTFHQSMSYEDFIEGIKPVEPTSDKENLSYSIQDGIFKNISLASSNRNNLNFELAYSKLLEDLKTNDNGMEIREPNFNFKIELSENGIDLDVDSSTYIKKIKKSSLKIVSDSQRYVGTWGKYYKSIFKLLTEKYEYRNEIENIKKNYVLIIDEINRGNVAQIFGELITLIEDTKRMGMAESLKVMLPYSKKYFEVPENLYLIGTMNTADRSVEALDAALRRRFSFTEMPPRPELLSTQRLIWEIWWKHLDKNWLDEDYAELHTGLYDLLGVDNNYDSDEKIWKRMFKEGKNESQIEYLVNLNPTGVKLDILLMTMNNRIEKLLDKDHQIGHSYFLSVYSIDALKAAFQNKIIPLLQEYFFGDYGKIGLVLGKGFVEKNQKQIVFAEFDAELASELSEKPSYTIKNVLQMTNEEFRAAIDLLVRTK